MSVDMVGYRNAAFIISTARELMKLIFVVLIIIIIIMTFIPRILASASNATKQSHFQTGKSLAVYKKLQKSQ